MNVNRVNVNVLSKRCYEVKSSQLPTRNLSVTIHLTFSQNVM